MYFTGLIYTVRWSNDNNNLLTTSSDYTACIWTLKNYNQTDFQVKINTYIQQHL